MNNNFADWNPLEENNENNNTTTNNTPLEPTNMVVPEQKSPSLEDTTEILGETMNMPVVDDSPKPSNAPMVDPTLPNTRNVESTIFNSDTRYNPVTGEEVKVQDVITAANQKNKKEEAPKVEEKQPEYKQTSTFSSILLFLFFVFLVAFVYFLPEVQETVDSYLHGGREPDVEEVTTGKLVCTLQSNTVNLNRDIERVFSFENNQLKRSSFTTTIRGDVSLDEKTLDELNEQCQKIKTGVSSYEGITVQCSYDAGQLVEKETFDYEIYPYEEVSNVYLDAGASLVELEFNENIDQVMTLMRQAGFTCDKEK